MMDSLNATPEGVILFSIGLSLATSGYWRRFVLSGLAVSTPLFLAGVSNLGLIPGLVGSALNTVIVWQLWRDEAPLVTILAAGVLSLAVGCYAMSLGTLAAVGLRLLLDKDMCIPHRGDYGYMATLLLIGLNLGMGII